MSPKEQLGATHTRTDMYSTFARQRLKRREQLLTELVSHATNAEVLCWIMQCLSQKSLQEVTCSKQGWKAAHAHAYASGCICVYSALLQNFGGFWLGLSPGLAGNCPAYNNLHQMTVRHVLSCVKVFPMMTVGRLAMSQAQSCCVSCLCDHVSATGNIRAAGFHCKC